MLSSTRTITYLNYLEINFLWNYCNLHIFLGWFDKNELLWDLGMDVSLMESKESLRKIIEFYEKEFDLVLLAERFDESLIVMKNLLCWDLEDITYLKVIISYRSRQYCKSQVLISKH